MNKTELIDAIAKKADLSKKDAEAALKATKAPVVEEEAEEAPEAEVAAEEEAPAAE